MPEVKLTDEEKALHEEALAYWRSGKRSGEWPSAEYTDHLMQYRAQGWALVKAYNSALLGVTREELTALQQRQRNSSQGWSAFITRFHEAGIIDQYPELEKAFNDFEEISRNSRHSDFSERRDNYRKRSYETAQQLAGQNSDLGKLASAHVTGEARLSTAQEVYNQAVLAFQRSAEGKELLLDLMRHRKAYDKINLAASVQFEFSAEGSGVSRIPAHGKEIIDSTPPEIIKELEEKVSNHPPANPKISSFMAEEGVTEIPPGAASYDVSAPALRAVQSGKVERS